MKKVQLFIKKLTPAVILILLQICSFEFKVFAQGSWEKFNTITHVNLKTIYFVDSLKGWVGGDSGIILYTSDGGQNWTFQNSTVNTSIHSLFFLDSLNGWALTWHQNIHGPNGTTFLKTTNGGLNWVAEVYPKDFIFLNSIFFVDSLNGWSCGSPGKILRTRDGGIEWIESRINNVQFSEFPIFKVEFFDENNGIGCGGIFDIFGVIWLTSNGGNTWDAFAVGPEPINDFKILDSNFVVAVGGDYEYGTSVSSSFDKGNNWNYRTLDIFGIAVSVDFRNPNEGWLILKGERKFLVTVDSGWTWTEYLAPDSVQPNKIFFADSLHGYAVCDSGYFLKYIPPIVTKVESIDFAKKNESKNQISIFPNPFNNNTTLKLNLVENSLVSISIYSILGEKVKDVTKQNFSAGNHSLTINASDLNSGVYLLSIKINDNSFTQKLILIK